MRRQDSTACITIKLKPVVFGGKFMIISAPGRQGTWWELWHVIIQRIEISIELAHAGGSIELVTADGGHDHGFRLSVKVDPQRGWSTFYENFRVGCRFFLYTWCFSYITCVFLYKWCSRWVTHFWWKYIWCFSYMPQI